MAPGRSLDSAINIYVVSTVERYSTIGLECSTDKRKVILIGASLVWQTILHEIGHTLSLEHVPSPGVAWDGDPEENYMNHGSGAARKYFTEGQIFRIHVNDRSAVNTLFNPGHPIAFSCGSTDADAKTYVCPELGKRIWPEY
jgi:hypothetical protein